MNGTFINGERIETAGGRVRAVWANGRRFPADVVLSNTGIRRTVELVGREAVGESRRGMPSEPAMRSTVEAASARADVYLPPTMRGAEESPTRRTVSRGVPIPSSSPLLMLSTPPSTSRMPSISPNASPRSARNPAGPVT